MALPKQTTDRVNHREGERNYVRFSQTITKWDHDACARFVSSLGLPQYRQDFLSMVVPPREAAMD
jgi:tRNA splicing ligase